MPSTRFSRQRTAILDALRCRKDHPTAETLYHSLRAVHPNISLGTVYRNLGLLERQRDVRRIAVENGPDRFDGDLTAHHHLQCSVCQAVDDLFAGDVVDLAAAQAQAGDALIQDVHVLFSGICGECIRADREKVSIQ